MGVPKLGLRNVEVCLGNAFAVNRHRLFENQITF